MNEWKGEVLTYINDELICSGPNDITTLGRNWVADRFRGRGSVSGCNPAGSAFLAVGYSGGTTTAAMSGLISEAPTGSIGRTIIGSTHRDIQGSTLYVTTWFYDSGGLGPLQEYGLFTTGYASDDATVLEAVNNPDSGCMIARKHKDVVTHNAGDALTVEWRITL